jgi:hypothetical protein
LNQSRTVPMSPCNDLSRKTADTPLGAIGRGLVADAVGSLAMDTVWYARYRRGGGKQHFLPWEAPPACPAGKRRRCPASRQAPVRRALPEDAPLAGAPRGARRPSSAVRTFSSRSAIATRPDPAPRSIPARAPTPRRLTRRVEHRQPEPLRVTIPRPTDTHGALSARSASPIRDRNKMGLPLPGGADTTVTRADVSSRFFGSERKTTLPRPGRAAGRHWTPISRPAPRPR